MLKRTILLAAVTALTATFAGAKAAEQVFLDSANRAVNGNFVLSRFIIVTVPSSTDHLACYDIGSTPGGPKILEVGIDVTLLNRFQDAIAAVGKPVRLCTPVDKNGEGVSNPNALWVCYRIEEPVVSVNEDVVVTNQFDPLNVDQAMRVKKIKTVCVPSELATP